MKPHQISKSTVYPLVDENYFTKLIELIKTSNKKCLVSMFIIDHNFDEKTQYLVDELLFEIACASWRGAYCKLLIGGSRENDSILFPALAAKARAEELGIESKIVSSQKNQNSHLKLVIVDDFVITGSHNWSKALTGDQVQDSIAIHDSGLASFTSVYFNNQWIQIPNNKYDVSL